jgi:hypothetical protein
MEIAQNENLPAFDSVTRIVEVMRDVRESTTHTNPKRKEEQRNKGGKKKNQNNRKPKSPKNPPLDV